MTLTSQRLATTGLFNILAFSILNVQTFLRTKDGAALIPNFVEFDACGLMVIAKNANGSFDVYNPDPIDKTNVRFRAHHLHSEEQEPIYTVTPTTQASTLPLPDCAIFGGFPFAVAHNRFSTAQEQAIPPGPAFYSPNLSAILCNQDAPSLPNVSLANGRFIINRTGVYQIRSSMFLRNVAEVPVVVDLSLVVDPDGSPAAIPPAYSSETLAPADFMTSEIGCIIAVDASVPVAQRTFEVRASASAPGVIAGGMNAGTIEVVKVGEKRPVIS